MKRAVAVIIQDESGDILLSKRSIKRAEEPLKWENVGGSVNPGEKFEEAVKREVMEELGVVVDDLIEALVYGGEDESYFIKVFLGIIQGIPKRVETEECDEIKWFKKENLVDVDLAEYTRKDFENLGWI